jgi:long-subunit fatty acid transport protein
MTSQTQRFFALDYDAADFSPDNVFFSAYQEGNGSDTAVNLGLLWKGGRWSAAAVFRQGPTFPLKARVIVVREFEFEFDAVLHLPDVFGFGLAFAPTENSKISFDYDRVRYSQLTDDFLVGISEFAFETSPADWKVDDADELHVGFEHGWRSHRVPVFLRLGFWYDPEHRLRFVGDIPASGSGDSPIYGLTREQQFIANRAIFQAGEDELHYAAGVGFRFGDRLQADVAIDYSERVTTAAVSAVIFLGSR